MTATTSRRVGVKPKTTTPRDTWPDGLGHGVTMAESGANPATARVSGDFDPTTENTNHRTPRVPPLYIATPTEQIEGNEGHGSYRQLTAKPAHLFTGLPRLDHGSAEAANSKAAHETIAQLWKAIGGNPAKLLNIGVKGEPLM